MYVSDVCIDEVVECPYNKNHRIASTRIQAHIVKCEKNFPVDYMEVCPYNATHRLFKSEMPHHIDTCPMRKFLQPELYQYKKKHGSFMSQTHSDASSTIDLNESWDEGECSYRRDIIMESTLACNAGNLQYRERRQPRQSSALLGNAECDTEVRPPFGFSEAIMVSGGEESNVEDLESVTSLMGIGRGVAKPRHAELLKQTGLGRGKGLPKKDNI